MRRFCWFACLCLLPAPAFADIVFSQRAETFQGAYLSETAVGGLPAYYAFDRFRLAADTRLTDIGWQGITLGSNPAQNFVVSLYAVDGGSPGQLLYTASSGAVQDRRVAGSAEEAYFLDDYNLAIDFDAAGGAWYWVSIYAADTEAHSWGVLLADSGEHLGGEYDGDPYEQGFVVAGENLAYTLEGSAVSGVTPEPPWVVLEGTGLVALGAMWRRRRTVST